jgi:hypothetical protein
VQVQRTVPPLGARHLGHPLGSESLRRGRVPPACQIQIHEVHCCRCPFHGPGRERHLRCEVPSFLTRCDDSCGAFWMCWGRIGRQPWCVQQKSRFSLFAPARAQIARVRRSPNALTSGRRPNVQHSVYLVLDSTHQRTRSVPSNGYRNTSMATDPPGPTKDLSDSRAEGMSIFALSSFTFLTLIQRYGPLSIRLPLGKAQARRLHRKRMSQSYPTNLQSCSGMSILLKGACSAMSGVRYVPLLVYNNFRFHCDAALERRRPSNSRDY